MKTNTVVTIGDDRYAWGIFMLIASMRLSGMDEPVLVGGRDFTERTCRVLSQWPGVAIRPLEDVSCSLTCYKPRVMGEATTEYITWVDSDGFFVGNCSALLPPPETGQVHIRNREPEENRLAFRGYEYGEDGSRIPGAILEAWRRDVGEGQEPALKTSCSACFLSLHRSHREFLRRWQEQSDKVLPRRDVGVTDRALAYYHQLDESVLNSVLCFSASAPRISCSFRLDKDPEANFVHFIGQPKPWQGWTRRALRHYDSYLGVLEQVLSAGLDLPGPLPWSLDRRHRRLSRVLALPVELLPKFRKRLKRLFS